jgi:hypothetical protein
MKGIGHVRPRFALLAGLILAAATAMKGAGRAMGIQEPVPWRLNAPVYGGGMRHPRWATNKRRHVGKERAKAKAASKVRKAQGRARKLARRKFNGRGLA